MSKESVFQVTARHTTVTDAMKKHAVEKLAKIEKMYGQAIQAHMTLDIQKTEHICHIIVKSGHLDIVVHSATKDMYAAIDEAVHRLQNKLRRWKDKIHQHHSKKLSYVDLSVDVIKRPYDEIEAINEDIEALNQEEVIKTIEIPKIIGTDTMKLKTLTLEEALMKIELSEKPFIIFKDEMDLLLKVLYKLPDGHYGLVQAV
ncbi:MAG: ribosome hibernation-promoting factor, HPF/YfiA family [Rhabdochlamydiaceae bacterium]